MTKKYAKIAFFCQEKLVKAKLASPKPLNPSVITGLGHFSHVHNRGDPNRNNIQEYNLKVITF